MRFEACHQETRRAGLAGAQKLAFAAQLQVLLGNAKTVLRLAQDGQPRAAVFAKWPLVEQDAARRLLAAPDAPAQQMKLGEAE